MSAEAVTRLADRVARGDRAAFLELFRTYGGAVMSTAMRLVRSRPVAEEVVEQTFLEVWRTACRAGLERADFETWVRTIAWSRALDAVRTGDASSHRTLASELADRAGDEPVARCLQALSRDQRVALELAFFVGLTQPEIAKFTGATLPAVKDHLRGGLQKMAQLLEAN